MEALGTQMPHSEAESEAIQLQSSYFGLNLWYLQKMYIKHMSSALYLSFATLTKVVSYFLQAKLFMNVLEPFVTPEG